MLRRDIRRAVLLHRQLRMRVDILIERLKFWQQARKVREECVRRICHRDMVLPLCARGNGQRDRSITENQIYCGDTLRLAAIWQTMTPRTETTVLPGQAPHADDCQATSARRTADRKNRIGNVLQRKKYRQ